MPTTSTIVGRAKLEHPDLGHDGGSGLWNKVHAIYQKLSDNLAIQWSGSITLADAASTDFMHNFAMALTELEVRIYESGVLIPIEQQTANYSIVGKSGDTTNGITITNNSGGSKTFFFYVAGFNLDKWLGREKAQVTTTDATITTIATIAIPSNKTVFLDVKISCRKDATNSNIYELKYMCENNAGTVTVTQMEKTFLEDIGSYDATITASAGNALVRVTGEAATSVHWSMVATKTYF